MPHSPEPRGTVLPDAALDQLFREARTYVAWQPKPVTETQDVREIETAAIQVLAKMVTDIDEFRRTGDPWSFLANPNSRLCSPDWCKAWGTDFCREHRR